jgi:hypothetical protein
MFRIEKTQMVNRFLKPNEIHQSSITVIYLTEINFLNCKTMKFEIFSAEIGQSIVVFSE